MDTLRDQASSYLHALQTTGDWKLLVQELSDLQEVLDDLHGHGQLNEHLHLVLECLLPIAPSMPGMITSIRSEVVKKACSAVAQFASVCGPTFEPFSNQVVLSLLQTACSKTQVVSRAGEDCFFVLSARSRYNLDAFCNYFDTARADEPRCLLVKQIPIFLKAWPKAELDPHFFQLKELLHRALRDKSHHVRTAAREAFCVFADTWVDHVEDLVDVPSPRHRPYFAQEHPKSLLSTRLVAKYGSPAPQVRTPLRPTSRVASSPSIDMDHDTPTAPAKRLPRRRLNMDDVAVPMDPTESMSSFSSMSSSEGEDIDDIPSTAVDGTSQIFPDQEGVVAAPVGSLGLKEQEPVAELDASLLQPFPSNNEAVPTPRPPSPTKPSLVQSVVGTVVTYLTLASVLFALYVVTGAVLSALALQQRGGLLVELEQLDMSVARAFHDLQTTEGSVESAMTDLMASMSAQRREAHDAMEALRESSAAWNKSMRDDMETFKVEFMAILLKPVDAS